MSRARRPRGVAETDDRYKHHRAPRGNQEGRLHRDQRRGARRLVDLRHQHPRRGRVSPRLRRQGRHALRRGQQRRVRAGHPEEHRPGRDVGAVRQPATVPFRRQHEREPRLARAARTGQRARSRLRGRGTCRALQERGRRRLVDRRAGADEAPDEGQVATRSRRPDSPQHRAGRTTPRADVDRHLGRGRLQDRRRRGDLGADQQERPGRLLARQVPRAGPVHPQAARWRGRVRAAVPAEPLRRLPHR